MASNEEAESGVLQFRGKDAQECEEFISAVIKHAHDQGKLRDDEWIADLVATCMTHDALRWWSALDEEYQASWKKLRQAMFYRYQPKFYGKSGEEAEEFVHAVRRRARDVGKQKDDEWITTTVYDCFVGDALRWYLSLDPSVRGDWEMLQVAILVQWPREGGFDLSLKTPTPASAASAPPKLKRGRIEVCKTGTDKTRFFLSKTPDKYGLQVTSSVAEAVVVEYDPSVKDPQTLLIPDDQIPNFDMVGACWYRADTASTNAFARLCALNSKTDAVSLGSEADCQGPKMRALWAISSTISKPHNLLQVTVFNGTATLFTSTYSDLSRLWFRTGQNTGEVAANIFLEPI